ncbi:MAG: hypothetical protein QGG67_06415 [Gammaproteobacteria bacterium]|nr:hypothetical protein [Gammaproteobacteria bacterium]
MNVIIIAARALVVLVIVVSTAGIRPMSEEDLQDWRIAVERHASTGTRYPIQSVSWWWISPWISQYRGDSRNYEGFYC